MKGEIDEVMKNASFKSVSVTTDTLYNWYGKVSGASVDYASTVSTKIADLYLILAVDSVFNLCMILGHILNYNNLYIFTGVRHTLCTRARNAAV